MAAEEVDERETEVNFFEKGAEENSKKNQTDPWEDRKVVEAGKIGEVWEKFGHDE